MDKIFDTSINTLISKDTMLSELYSHSVSHFAYVIPNVMFTLPNPDPTSFPKFAEDSLKEILFDECVDFLQIITGDSSSIDNHPTLKELIQKRVNTNVTKSIYSTHKKMDGVPWARWVWQDKLVSKISEDVVKIYIIGLVHTNQFQL
jgi:hypothetical protein